MKYLTYSEAVMSRLRPSWYCQFDGKIIRKGKSNGCQKGSRSPPPTKAIKFTAQPAIGRQ